MVFNILVVELKLKYCFMCSEPVKVEKKNVIFITLKVLHTLFVIIFRGMGKKLDRIIPSNAIYFDGFPLKGLV